MREAEEEDFGGADVRQCAECQNKVPHDLASVDEKDEVQITRQEQQGRSSSGRKMGIKRREGDCCEYTDIFPSFLFYYL